MVQNPNTTILKIQIKVNRITQFFNQSTKQTDKLREVLKVNNTTYSNLIQSVSTRCNSKYSMVERFQDYLDEVTLILNWVVWATTNLINPK